MANRYGYIDCTGKQVIPVKYWLAGPFHEGLALALVVFPANEQDDITTQKQLSFPIKGF
jgi:hypothetical protein